MTNGSQPKRRQKKPATNPNSNNIDEDNCIPRIFPFAVIETPNGEPSASTRYANKTKKQNSLVY